MTIELGSIQWPKPSEHQAELGALLRRAEALGISLSSTERQDNGRIDELVASWPEHVPRFPHPGDWRPSVNEAVREAIATDWSVEPSFKMEAFAYRDWLRNHMIIDCKVAGMVRDVLMHPERGGDRNLQYIAFTDQNYFNTARKFEQEYLGLPPVQTQEDESDRTYNGEDCGLRIQEDGLYGPYGFQFGGERDGGLLPAAALAGALKTTPEELNRRLSTDEVFEKDEDGRYTAPWNMIRTDNHLLLARPYEEDPNQILVGPVRELTEFGSYLLENLLRAYEAGTKH